MPSFTRKRFIAVFVFFCFAVLFAIKFGTVGQAGDRMPTLVSNEQGTASTKEAQPVLDVGLGSHTINVQLGRDISTQYLGAEVLRQAVRSEQVQFGNRYCQLPTAYCH